MVLRTHMVRVYDSPKKGTFEIDCTHDDLEARQRVDDVSCFQHLLDQ